MIRLRRCSQAELGVLHLLHANAGGDRGRVVARRGETVLWRMEWLVLERVVEAGQAAQGPATVDGLVLQRHAAQAQVVVEVLGNCVVVLR